MQLYPKELQPTATHEVRLPSGTTVHLPKACPQFDVWRGVVNFDTYGKSPILSFAGKPIFAEILILRLLEQAGWQGVWVDTYRGRYLTDIWIETALPDMPQTVLEKIYSLAGSRSGCFDIFAWRDANVLFAESKHAKHDRIRWSQQRWLEAALGSGLPLESFLIVEWSAD